MANAACEICGKSFTAKPSYIKKGWGRFCSPKCQYKSYLKGKFVNCEICGKTVWRAPRKIKHSKSGKFFCNKSCQTLWRNKEFSGMRHANWKNGESVKYRERMTHSRVPQICNVCKNQDTRVLAVHHLDKNRRNNNLDNLAWVCHNCHYLIHHYSDSVRVSKIHTITI